MSEIVTLHHNEPMTTSLAIAEGVEMEHKSVIQLARNHLERLQRFGEVTFQMRLNPQGSPTEFFWLNEQQATFLITLMRNTPVVLDFKEALVRAFFAMRGQIQHQPGNPPFITSNLAHGADLAVAADRTFRSFLRAARSAGMPLPQALRVANRQTAERTGMNMLKELGVDPEEMDSARTSGAVDGMPPELQAVADWARKAEPAKLYTIPEILLLAAGVSPDSGVLNRLVGRTGQLLRGMGFRRSRMRTNGRQVTYWHK